MQTSEVLNRTADAIEGRGWSQGDGWITDESIDGAPVCLEGGMQAALGLSGVKTFDQVWACPAYAAVAAYVDAPVLYAWNDKYGRTAAEVVEILRACAVIEAARESELAEVPC